MFLEAILTVGCVFGNEPGCTSVAQGYYEYAGIKQNADKFTREFSKDHKIISSLIGAGAVFQQKKATFPIFQNTIFTIEMHQTNQSSLILYKKGF